MYLSPTIAPRTEVVVVGGALVGTTVIGVVGWFESVKASGMPSEPDARFI
jgi:hypothetical protein